MAEGRYNTDPHGIFEVFFNKLRMTAKMFGLLLAVPVVIQFSLFWILVRVSMDSEQWKYFWRYLVARGVDLFSGAVPLHFLGYTRSADDWVYVLHEYANPNAALITFLFVLSSFSYLVLIPMYRHLKKKALEGSLDMHIRGAKELQAKQLNKIVKDAGKEGSIHIGEILLPYEAETRNILSIGQPGQGKTVMISQMVEEARKRENSRILLWDVKGDFTEMFYEQGRVKIFDVTDERSEGYNPFLDCNSIPDLIQVTTSLIPTDLATDQERHWIHAAADVLYSILIYLWMENRKTPGDIYRECMVPREELKNDLSKYLPYTARGMRHLESDDEKYAQSVLATMVPFVSGFEFAPDGNLSASSFLDSNDFLIIKTQLENQEATKTLNSLLIDMIARKLLSRPDIPRGERSRTFFFLDEFANLQKLPSALKLFTMGRSKGAAPTVAVQGIDSLMHLYGEKVTNSIIDVCGTHCHFRTAGKTSKFLEGFLGKAQISRHKTSHSVGIEDGRDGLSYGEDIATEPLKLSAELDSLPELSAFTRIYSCPHWALNRFSVDRCPTSMNATAHCSRRDLDMEEIRSNIEKAKEEALEATKMFKDEDGEEIVLKP